MTTEEKIANQRIVNDRRREYVHDRTLTHDQFYSWLCEFIGVTEQMIPFSKDVIRASTNAAFNGIPTPLRGWDSMDSSVRMLANAKGIAWSLSDTVCCLKCVARKVRGW